MKKVFESHNIVEFFKTKKEGDSVPLTKENRGDSEPLS